jgi:hypothetical protein
VGDKAEIHPAWLARANLRELARGAEEVAVLLEGAGYRTVPDELMKVSRRLTELREALERAGRLVQ